MPEVDKKHQAKVLARHIIKAEPRQLVIDIYTRNIGNPTLDNRQRKLLEFAIRHPWSLGMLDGGLALTDPHAELRRRLYVMFAILEAQPEYADRFLARQRGPLYIFVLAVIGMRAACRALAGTVLVRLVV